MNSDAKARKKNKRKFTNFQARWFAPIIIHFELDSFIQPVSGCSQDGEKKLPLKHSKHVGFEHYNPTPVFSQVEKSENCMWKLVLALEVIA